MDDLVAKMERGTLLPLHCLRPHSSVGPGGAENLIRPCEQDEWIETMECVNSILAMSGDVLAAQTHDPALGRTR